MLALIRTILACVAFFLAAISDAAALEGIPANGTFDFAVMRQGSEIGYHRIVFRRDGNRLTVDISVDTRVRILGVTVYRFVHQSQEIWEGDRLIALKSETDEDGTPHVLALASNGAALQGVHNGKPVVVHGDQIPISLWNPTALRRDRLLNSIHGGVMPTTVTKLGQIDVKHRGTTVTAQEYLIDAKPDFKRWVAFDSAGTLIHVRLYGRDGSEVTYELR
jgi:hypothetical protein